MQALSVDNGETLPLPAPPPPSVGVPVAALVDAGDAAPLLVWKVLRVIEAPLPQSVRRDGVALDVASTDETPAPLAGAPKDARR